MRQTIEGFGRVRMSLETDNLGEAIIRRDRIFRDPSAHLVADDLREYAAHQRARGLSERWVAETQHILGRLVEETGAKSIRQMKPAAVAEWLTQFKAGTGASYLQRLKTFSKWQVMHQRPDIVRGVPPIKFPPKVRKRFLSPDECAKLLAGCGEDDELRFLVMCAMHAGLRRGEAIASRPHWFDLDAGLLHVQNEPDFTIKDRECRTIPLTDDFLAFLRRYGLRSPYMFAPAVPSPHARKGKAKPGPYQVYRSDFRRRWASLLRRTGIKCTFHDLRRTFASLLVSKGVSVYKVAKWLGDGVGVVEAHYGHLMPADEDINAAWR